LAAGVHVFGWVHLEKRANVATGVVILYGTQLEPIVIGDQFIIRAGAGVTNTLSPGTRIVGFPAEPIRMDTLRIS
jgi:serine acetyltransferase